MVRSIRKGGQGSGYNTDGVAESMREANKHKGDNRQAEYYMEISQASRRATNGNNKNAQMCMCRHQVRYDGNKLLHFSKHGGYSELCPKCDCKQAKPYKRSK